MLKYIHIAVVMATLTIRDIPDELHAKLKERAAGNRRSLNQQVIVELESSLENAETEEERIARRRTLNEQANREIDRIREMMPHFVTPTEIREAINEGRA